VFYNYAAPPALAAGHRLNREPLEICKQTPNIIFLSRVWRISRLRFICRPNPNGISSPQTSVGGPNWVWSRRISQGRAVLLRRLNRPRGPANNLRSSAFIHPP